MSPVETDPMDVQVSRMAAPRSGYDQTVREQRGFAMAGSK